MASQALAAKSRVIRDQWRRRINFSLEIVNKYTSLYYSLLFTLLKASNITLYYRTCISRKLTDVVFPVIILKRGDLQTPMGSSKVSSVISACCKTARFHRSLLVLWIGVRISKDSRSAHHLINVYALSSLRN